MPLATDLFDYDLPPHLIAQTPAARRDQSRLLVVDRTTHTFAHHTFADLPQFLRSGDTLFRNNAAVLPARLHASRPTGGQVECFLLRPADGAQAWHCLVKPGRKLPVGSRFAGPDGAFAGEIIARPADGTATVKFTTPADEPITAVANRIGDVPLPPYITRPDDEPASRHATQRASDLERYQTVYADRAKQVAVAAPTAGLHFTPELFAALERKDVRTADVTLHVGLGTFKPISSPNVEAHPIHRELYEIPTGTQRALFPPRSGRRVAVGTTSVRTIEDFLAKQHAPLGHDFIDEADLYVYPPRKFRGVDALITNFHQPRSTLLCLVSAFLSPGTTDGIAWIRELYAEAIAREYRFFSYGDAMLIL
jgi:S-adenosylmethionine:tRNA ribosyltransferase-isomerase